jgi:Ran GTPase-activating protein (RanGAP) involved in mRNA processing and transport
MSKLLVAWASIRVMEVENRTGVLDLCGLGKAEPEYLMSLGKGNKKQIAFTKLCEASASTLADTIREYIEKEKLTEEVLYMDLSSNHAMSCESLGRILELLAGYQKQVVDLSSNSQLGDSMVATILPLLEVKRSHLVDLKLAQCGLTVPGLKGLMQTASNSKLRLLDISDTRIRDETELIEQVMELPMIEALSFRFCDLSPSDIRTIAEGLPFTSVKKLELAGNAFGSEGLEHLARTLSESMVEELDLCRAGIVADCEGLTQLAEAWAKRPFKKLFLKNNPMGHAEIIKFITMLGTLVPSVELDETFMGNVDIPRCC